MTKGITMPTDERYIRHKRARESSGKIKNENRFGDEKENGKWKMCICMFVFVYV